MGKKFYGLRGTSLNIAIAIVAGTDFALFGYDQDKLQADNLQRVLGGLLTLESFLQYFPQVNTEMPPPGSTTSEAANIQGITVGGYTLGCFFGAVATIWLGNLLGRKRTIFVGTVIMVIGAAIQAASVNLPMLIISRWVTGFGNGMNTSTVPTWQSETSKPHRRGQLVMIEGSLIVFGVFLSYWVDYGFAKYESSEISWRFPIAFQIILALFILIAIPGLPESPRWLVLKGKDEKALEVLSALHDLPEDDKKIQDEMKAVKETVFEMSQGGFRGCFKTNKNRNLHRTILGYVNQMFQQISGINILTYYAATLFVQIGISRSTSRLLSALLGTEYWIASWIAIPTVERFGRRKLMLFGAIGQATTMYILGGLTSVSNTNKPAGIAAAVFLFVFNSFFAIGWLGMTWLYPAEITPLSIRAPANALATTANWIFNFMVVMVTPPAFAGIAWKTWIVFATINAGMVPCVYFFFPETAGRSLEEMDEIFQSDRVKGVRGVFEVVKVARELPRRYGRKGELLIAFEEVEERRRSSVVSAGEKKDGDDHLEG